MAFWKPGAPKPQAPLSLEVRVVSCAKLPAACHTLKSLHACKINEQEKGFVALTLACAAAPRQVDRLGGGDAPLLPHNRHDALGLEAQRQRLPAAKARPPKPTSALSGALTLSPICS